MYTVLDSSEVPEAILNELQRLNNRNRLIKNFVVIGGECYGKTKRGEPACQVGVYLPDEGRTLWGGFHTSIETQLIRAGVCAPDFTAQQELKWRELRQVLVQFIPREEVVDVLFKDCRTAILQGWVDSLERKLPLATYLRCKRLIGELVPDQFGKDFSWYSGEELPEDSWRGLEVEDEV